MRYWECAKKLGFDTQKGGGALRRLWEKNFEAIVLVLKIGLGG